MFLIKLICFYASVVTSYASAAANLTPLAVAASTEAEDLKRWAQNPQSFFKQLPPRNEQHPSVFSDEEIANEEFVLIKVRERSRLFKKTAVANPLNPNFQSGFSKKEDPRIMLGSNYLSKLSDMESFRSGRIAGSPWSGDYWPLADGLLGERSFDRNFSRRKSWFARYNFILAQPFFSIFQARQRAAIDQLSTAEKYDLITGSTEGFLTTAMWRKGQSFNNKYGRVPRWMGICHGWSPASYMSPRPQRSVEVLSFDGSQKIKFFPGEIKGLISLLWAEAKYPVYFLGGRCRVSNPARDGQGRVIIPECFDSNPGTWHTILVNQIGVRKKSFIMDATYDYQVWNQPLVGYNYNYFNPLRKIIVHDLSAAAVPVEILRDQDKIQLVDRDPRTQSVVGVTLSLTYLKEIGPRATDYEPSTTDKFVTVRYLYDLELDADGNIIGGEWYSKAHPDFVWTPTPNAVARTPYDSEMISSWKGFEVLPSDWQSAAQKSSRQGLPSQKILEQLIMRSR